MSDNDNVIIVKAWSSRLRGKESAIKFRQKCIQSLRLDETLRINMADVKEVSEGFAFECFGKLNRFANDHGTCCRGWGRTSRSRS